MTSGPANECEAHLTAAQVAIIAFGLERDYVVRYDKLFEDRRVHHIGVRKRDGILNFFPEPSTSKNHASKFDLSLKI